MPLNAESYHFDGCRVYSEVQVIQTCLSSASKLTGSDLPGLPSFNILDINDECAKLASATRMDGGVQSTVSL